MLVPNTEYIIVKVEDKSTLIPGKTFTGKVHAVGQPDFAPQPIGGDGTNFSFARQPDSFGVKKGDEVIVGSFCDIIDHNGNTFVISFKTEVYAIIKDEAEELDLFNQEMREDTMPSYLTDTRV